MFWSFDIQKALQCVTSVVRLTRFNCYPRYWGCLVIDDWYLIRFLQTYEANRRICTCAYFYHRFTHHQTVFIFLLRLSVRPFSGLVDNVDYYPKTFTTAFWRSWHMIIGLFCFSRCIPTPCTFHSHGAVLLRTLDNSQENWEPLGQSKSNRREDNEPIKTFSVIIWEKRRQGEDFTGRSKLVPPKLMEHM